MSVHANQETVKTIRRKFFRLTSQTNFSARGMSKVHSFQLLLWSLGASSRTILSMGRSSIDVLVFNTTLLTSPSPLLGFTSWIRPRGHEFLGELSSTTRTTSPTSKLAADLVHFCLSCKLGRYSLSHLRQNTSDRYWTCRHLRRE